MQTIINQEWQEGLSLLYETITCINLTQHNKRWTIHCFSSVFLVRNDKMIIRPSKHSQSWHESHYYHCILMTKPTLLLLSRELIRSKIPLSTLQQHTFIGYWYNLHIRNAEVHSITCQIWKSDFYYLSSMQFYCHSSKLLVIYPGRTIICLSTAGCITLGESWRHKEGRAKWWP